MNTLLQRLRGLFTVRNTVWSVFSIATLIAVLIAVGNWTGARRWAAVKAMMEREGETFDFKALLPPAVDESRNFCAITPLREISLPGDETSVQGVKRNALETLAKGKAKSPVPVTGGPALGRKMDVAGWIKFARESKLLDSATDSPRDAFQAFDRAYPLAKELAEAAATHPEAAFIPTLKERTLPPLLYSLPVPHYPGAQQASRALRLRAALALESGDTTAAVQSIQAILRFSDALLKEPLLISYLVSVSILDAGEEGVWDLLEKRVATEADLTGLEASFQALDFPKAQLAAMRGELATGIEAIECIQGNPETIDTFVEITQGPVRESSKPLFFGFLRHLIPNGFYDHNKATLADLYQDYFIQPLKTGDDSALRKMAAKIPAVLRSHRPPFHVSYVFAGLAMPVLSPVLDRSCWAEAVHRQAILACALERYYLQHQAYPKLLNELVPTFIARLPADPADNQPMRYRQTQAGRYALWSVGFDLKDEGGKVTVQMDPKTAEAALRKSTYRGDWSWQYEEAKPATY